MTKSWIFSLLAPSLLLAHSVAQDKPAPQPAMPTIVSNVDEVTIDLVVRDKNKPVMDLKPEDISVSDSGSAVKLSGLRLVTGAPAEDRRVTLIFDRLDPSSAKNARSIAAKMLKMVPARQFSFAVMNVEGRLRLFQDFTSDDAALERAINAASDITEGSTVDAAALPEKNLMAEAQTGKDPSGKLVGMKERSGAKAMLATIEESQRIVQDQHCRPWQAGLLAAARKQQQYSGRKVVIFFEQAPQLDSNAKDMLISIANAANRSGVSIYTIDATGIDEQAGQGLLATQAMGSMAAASHGPVAPAAPTAQTGASAPMAPPGSITAGADSASRMETEGLSGYKSPFAELAESTGGVHITATDHLKKPMQQLVEDMTTYYEATYASPVQEYDGKFRTVSIKPIRKRLKIHSKAGYFALPPDSGTGIRPFETPLLKILADSPLPTDLKFRAAVLRLGELPSGNENAVVVEVPISELDSRDDPNSNLYSVHASIVAQIRNKDGVVIEHFSEDVPRHGSLDSKTGAQAESITMQRHFTGASGQYVLEAAVLDGNNHKSAAQRIEFEIAPEAGGPALSDIAVVQSVVPLTTQMESDEPLRYGSGKVIPTISGRVPRGSKQLSFFFVVHPDASSAEQPVLEMEVLKSNESIAQVPLRLIKATGPGSIPYLASIQASLLSGGEYQVIEKLTQGGKTSESSVAFRIEGPELASATKPDGPASAQTDDMTTSGLQLPATDGPSGRHVVITSLPAGSVPPPTADELQTLVERTRKRALEYGKSLPNFICVEVTNRSVDQSGGGSWKHRDSIAEKLAYHDKLETRTTLEVNGKRSSLTRSEMNSSWPTSIGEFGSMLNLVFAESSKTHFEWKEAGTLSDGSGVLQVLSYSVARENATLDLAESNNTIGVGFHGLVYIDATTGGVRRITLEADGLPKAFSMHAAAMTVDYDYVAISGRDYLLPVHSTVSLRRHQRQIELNEIAFRNYRRFASRAKIKMIQ